MNVSESDLWPSDVVVDVLSPLMILNEQAEALTKRTQGIVRGEVLPGNAGTFEQLSFDIVAPAIAIRQRLLLARFSKEMPYPVVLIAAPLVRHFSTANVTQIADEQAEIAHWKLSSERELSQARLASSPSEVRALLRLVFHAPATKAALLSLIARSNEVTGSTRAGNEEGTTPAPSPPSEIEPPG